MSEKYCYLVEKKPHIKHKKHYFLYDELKLEKESCVVDLLNMPLKIEIKRSASATIHTIRRMLI